MTHVLVTGAGGFIGSQLTRTILAGTDWQVTAMDSFRHRGTTDRLILECDGVCPVAWSGDRLNIMRHDLSVPVSLQMASRIGPVDIVFAVASGSHVDTSITEPREFVENNVAVGLTVLEFVREYNPGAHVVLVSTDEVYGPVEPGQLHAEWDPIIPSNPYSASKAAQENLAVAWWRSFGLNVTIVNMHNVYGPGQHPEKFVPKVIGKLRAGESVPIHATDILDNAANTGGSRHWLYVGDVAEALIKVSQLPVTRYLPALSDVQRPNRWNIASSQRWSNVAMAERIAAVMGVDLEWHPVVARPGRDHHYGLTNDRLAYFGWRAITPLNEGLSRTVKWYDEHPHWLAG